MASLHFIVEGRWCTIPPMGCFILKGALCSSIDIETHKKWFNLCTMMSLGATKVNGWLQGDASI